MALVTGLKLFNNDPSGQLPWMKLCNKSMEYGFGKTITHANDQVKDGLSSRYSGAHNGGPEHKCLHGF